MPTRTGAGYSCAEDPGQAGRRAAEQAITALATGRVDLVLVFAASSYRYEPLLAGVRSVTGAAPLIGCSSAGEFTHQEVGRRSVAIMAISSEDMRFKIGLGTRVKGDQG